MLAFTTRMTPSANCSSDSRVTLRLQPFASEGLRSLQVQSEFSAEKQVRLQTSEQQVGIGHGGLRSAPVADGAGIGARGFRSDPQRSAGVEARQRTAAGADGVNVEHGHAHRQARHLRLVAGLGLATHQGDVG